MKASENETVAEIREDVSEYLTSIGPSEYPSETQFEEFADRFEAAHKREVDSLNFKLMTAKSEQKTAANVIIEQTNKVERLECEVAELRECLKDALTFVCSGCKDLTHKMCRFNRWRKALEGVSNA